MSVLCYFDYGFICALEFYRLGFTELLKVRYFNPWTFNFVCCLLANWVAFGNNKAFKRIHVTKEGNSSFHTYRMVTFSTIPFGLCSELCRYSLIFNKTACLFSLGLKGLSPGLFCGFHPPCQCPCLYCLLLFSISLKGNAENLSLIGQFNLSCKHMVKTVHSLEQKRQCII